MPLPYQDRKQAGQTLGEQLLSYQNHDDVLVLGLPRGGVPVAYEIARALEAPLDVWVVRKLGTPGQQELAMGAIASGGKRVLNDKIVRSLGLSEETIDEVAEHEQKELERREQAYRGDRERPAIEGKTVILVDDGLATGATMRAAIEALRQQNPGRIIMAVPVAPPETIEQLSREVDEVICPQTPSPFGGIGGWYERFPQTSDDEVRDLLTKASKDQTTSTA